MFFTSSYIDLPHSTDLREYGARPATMANLCWARLKLIEFNVSCVHVCVVNSQNNNHDVFIDFFTIYVYHCSGDYDCSLCITVKIKD